MNAGQVESGLADQKGAHWGKVQRSLLNRSVCDHENCLPSAAGQVDSRDTTDYGKAP